jgi:hypothetical protein
MIVSPTVFLWWCTLMVVGVAGAWVIVEVFRLKKVLGEDLSRPTVRDRLFGSLIGLAVGIIGVAGAIRYHL